MEGVVYLLWHIHHQDQNRHFDEEGDIVDNPEEGDQEKILGVFSSARLAEEAIEYYRTQPGFVDEPACFSVDEYELNERLWIDGYVTEYVGEVE